MQVVRLHGYAWALGATAVATLAGLAMRPRFDLVNVAMAYVPGVGFVALRQARGPAIAAALFAVVAFDWTFVPPEGTFTVDDVQYLFTFGVLIVLALLISRLTDDIRSQSDERACLAVAAEAERIRGTLLASISHDLRTPLAVLTGASSSLAERGDAMDPAERATIARDIFDRAREMSDHVDKVLDMTRLDAGGMELRREWVEVPELLSALRRQWAPALAHHHVVVDVPPDLPLVRADAALLAKALGNLLENVARHTPPGTIVRLTARQSGSEVILGVEDRASGLREDDLERIFAKFDHRTPEQSTAGLGLGLAICRAIVKLHGGRTWAEGLDGGGTVFHVALPVPPAPPMPVEHDEA